MKQFIPTNQAIEELSKKGYRKLSEYWVKKYPTGITLPSGDKLFGICLDVGQMIEFLDKHNYFIHTCRELPDNEVWIRKKHYKYAEVWSQVDYLCDALWQAVKEILEK